MTDASIWRRELARELSSAYAEHECVKMICLGGSAARGISDRWSDLDIIVYWDAMDEEWIRNEPLAGMGIHRTDLMSFAPDTFTESYHMDGLKVDFGHVTLDSWKEWVEPFIKAESDDPDLLGMVGGFLDSICLYGREMHDGWRERLKIYPAELVEKVVKSNLRIYVKGYLTHQCLDRGDVLAFQDGMCSMLKKMLNITAAINGICFSASEPRWVDYYLDRFSLKPLELEADKIGWMLANPGEESEDMLYRIVDGVLDLIAQEVPGMREKVELKKKRLEDLSVRPCSRKPSMPVK